MPEGFDFSLPEQETQASPHRRRVGHQLVQWLILAGIIALIVLQLRGVSGAERAASRGGLPDESLKELALKLEKQALHGVAARAWEQYITAAGLSGKEAARIWYRMGVLHQDAEQYAQALDAFYRSESYATVEGLDLEIARRTQECLETMGKFAALRRELDQRVDLGKDAAAGDSEVVAEIGAMRITAADLDQRIEDSLQLELDRLAPLLRPEERRARKEELLKQFAAPAQRRQLLQQFLLEEVLYREARRRGLAEQPELRRQLRDQERRVLSAAVLQEDVMGQVQITPADIETYYQAHKADFVEADEDGEEQQQSLDEVQGRIYQTLRSRKEQELQQVLFDELMSRYDVVIHQSAFATGEGGAQ